jgi:hypothetical protein
MKGWKTYAAAGAAIAVAALELAGVDVVPSLDQGNALNALWAALTAAFLRHAQTPQA